MTKRIDVPGVGVVEFPENMSDEQITNAIRTNIMPKYAAKPETALQTFGRSAASIPDTALNLITGALDYGAYNLARAAGLSPEEAQRQTTSPKDVIGRALGVAGTPGYENAPQRQLGNYLGQTLSEGIINPLTETTGLPEQDVSSMFNSLTMAVPGMAKGGYQAVKPALQATKDVVGGAVGRGTGYIAKPGEAPTGYQVPSSRAPLRDTVMLPEDMARFERGEMPYGQMPTEVPIQQLPRNAVERTALKMSGGEIPYQGQAARAFGERLGETYRNPITAAIDIGSLFTTGVPLVTAARTGLAGVQGAADAILARRGLDPNLPTRLADYQSGARPMPGTPPAPAPGPVSPASINYPLTVQGPGQQLPPSVMTAPDLSRRVNIEGQQFNLPSQINVSNSQSARPQTPAQQSQQMAVQKLQEVQRPMAQPTMTAGTSAPAPIAQPVARAPAPKLKAPIEAETTNFGKVGLRDIKNIEARAKETGEPIKYTFFRKGEGNVTVTLNKEIKFTPDPDLKLTSAKEFNNGNKEFAGTLGSTGEPITVKFIKDKDISVYNQNGEVIKQFDTKGKVIGNTPSKKPPSNVSQMIVDDGSSTWNSMKLPDNASPMERKIAMSPQASRDIIEQNLRKQLDGADPKSKALLEETLKLFDKYRFK